MKITNNIPINTVVQLESVSPMPIFCILHDIQLSFLFLLPNLSYAALEVDYLPLFLGLISNFVAVRLLIKPGNLKFCLLLSMHHNKQPLPLNIFIAKRIFRLTSFCY